jgi:hypothetical protein
MLWMFCVPKKAKRRTRGKTKPHRANNSAMQFAATHIASAAPLRATRVPSEQPSPKAV